MLANGLLALHPNKRINIERLKRSFILQDKTYVANAEYFIAAQRYEDLGNIEQADEIEMLIASKIIHSADEEFNIEDSLLQKPSNDELVNIQEAFKRAESSLFHSMGLPYNPAQISSVTFVNNIEDSNKTLNFLNKIEGLKEHYFARVLSLRTSKQFHPLSGANIVTGVLHKIPALRLEILNFPIINTDVTWNRLLEFKQDEDTQLHIMRFNRLLNKLFATSQTTKEIQEEIVYMLAEYTKHVELAEMRYTASKRIFFFKYAETWLGSLTSNTLELLKPVSDTLNIVFNIDKDKIEYLQAKNSAPEKEVSLLYELQNLT